MERRMTLKDRLAKKREERRLGALLAGHPDLRIVRQVDNEAVRSALSTIWKEIGETGAQPTLHCPEDLSVTELVDALQPICAKIVVAEDLVLSLCDYDFLRDHLVAPMDARTVVDLVLDPDVSDLVVYSPTLMRYAAMTTEEYEYEIFEGVVSGQ